jgi:hypothetical protein
MLLGHTRPLERALKYTSWCVVAAAPRAAATALARLACATERRPRPARSSLSILGSLFIIGTFILFRDARAFGRRLIFVLAVFDLIFAIVYALPEGDADVCRAQSYLGSLMTVVTLVWTCCIATYAYLAVSGRRELQKAVPYFLSFTFGLALVCFIPTVAVEPGWAGLWCWIPITTDESRAVRALYYFVIWTCWIFNLVAYLFIRFVAARPRPRPRPRPRSRCPGSRKVSQLLRVGKISHSMRVDAFRTVTLIPLVLILMRLPGSLNRVLQQFGDTRLHRVLLPLQALGDPGQGFADAILFGVLNRPLRQRVLDALRTCRIGRDEEESVGGDVDEQDAAAPRAQPLIAEYELDEHVSVHEPEMSSTVAHSDGDSSSSLITVSRR